MPLDSDVLEVAEAHVRIVVQKLGLHVMGAETRAELGACAKLAREVMDRLKKLMPDAGPEDQLEELAPHGMQLFMLMKAYECGPACIFEAVKRHVPELAPIVEGLLAD
jgi:hypothetical protein